MADDLRTRIAAVLNDELEIGLHLTEKLADVLIRELGLREQRPNSAVYRYITEWQTDE